MSMDDGLRFWGKYTLVKSLADKHRRRHGLPRFGPFVGGKNLLLLILIDDGVYKSP
jgi:hypothetical protein